MFNTHASPKAAVLLELPGSTCTWQCVQLASQLTLRRSAQLIPVAKPSPLPVSNDHNYASWSGKDWLWTILRGVKQKQFFSCPLKWFHHLTWRCVVAAQPVRHLHPYTYICGQGSSIRCLRIKRCLHECLNQPTHYVWSLCRDPGAGHTFHSFNKIQENY